MIHKYVFSIFVGALAVGSVVAQTPEPKERSPFKGDFAFTFEDGGSYLGVQTREVTKENFAKFGLRDVQGVAIEKVVDGSPAAAAGLKDGDVIVEFNGEKITSGKKLSRLVSEVSPDHQVRLKVLRGGSEQSITATVGKSPAPRFDNGNFKFTMPEGGEKWDLGKLKEMPEFRGMAPFENFKSGDLPKLFELPDGQSFKLDSRSGRQIGVSVYPLTKQLGDRYGVQGGVMINTVREDSAAAKGGLRAGDVIFEVDGKAVHSELDLIRAINEKKDGAITLNLIRDGNRQNLSVTPEPAKDGGFFFRFDNEKDGAAPMLERFSPARPMSPTPPVLESFFRGWVI